ncbi:DUF503 domain-containing protein [bacterium]|nr:DUF503 domain-containing protein [bacterium]
MLIGTMKIELFFPEIFSLKEKRFILKSLKTKIQNQFNVSVAEVDFHDKWQRSCLGIACVSNDRRFLDSTLSKVMNSISREDQVEIMDHVTEIL